MKLKTIMLHNNEVFKYTPIQINMRKKIHSWNVNMEIWKETFFKLSKKCMNIHELKLGYIKNNILNKVH